MVHLLNICCHDYRFELLTRSRFADDRAILRLVSDLENGFASMLNPLSNRDLHRVPVYIRIPITNPDSESITQGYRRVEHEVGCRVDSLDLFQDYYLADGKSLVVFENFFTSRVDSVEGLIEIELSGLRFTKGGAGAAMPATFIIGSCINEWLSFKGVVAIHASAMASRRGGLLIAADSGAGKSTTAVSLARRGWDFLSDDQVFLDPRKSPTTIFSFPKKIGIDRRTLGFFRELSSLERNPTRRHFGYKQVAGDIDACLPEEEFFFDINEFFDSSILEKAEIAAIVFLERTGGNHETLRRIPPSEALLRLLHHSKRPPDEEREKQRFSGLSNLVRGTKSFTCSVPEGTLLDIDVMMGKVFD